MKSKKFLISIIFLMVIDFLAVMIMVFFANRVNEEKNVVLSVKNALAKNENDINSNNFLKKLASDIKEDKLRIYSMFLSRDDLIRIIKSLESIESDAGVSLKISSIEVDGKNEVAAPTLSFMVRGSFSQLFRYLYFLENLPYLIVIDKASFYKIEADKERAEEWQASFNIKLDGYEKK